MMSSAPNPSHTSYYVSDQFYQDLIDAYSGWIDDDKIITKPDLRDQCRALLEREARILDQGRLDEWLALFVPECIYWAPGTKTIGDPRREVAVAFDDRRRLEDRVYRLQTAHAWSQRPMSRTVRMVSNVEVFTTSAADILMVRSNFQITEFWAGETRFWSGWTGHRLKRTNGGLEIVVKQINLIDCDQNLRNPSIIL